MSKIEGVSETALMKRFVLDGIANFQMEQAIVAYQQGEADISAAAQYAGISVYRKMTELEARDVTPPASAQKFREGLQTLFDIFGGSEALRQTLDEFKTAEN